ncbi:tetratricopeptide repeat protein [Pontivivens ytuae]|uniref:Tetratricopeptide repeat protein n=1 Tax=Pontivivens ytuae TaxID=2789856 RepID=A0A7S9QB60_9RHOB|nr:tetratricopeptide repeat protein [Pontivivens ytuae]QPH52833.1 tetratricopeptide repeat protein [Pontivivens ytuae]
MRLRHALALSTALFLAVGGGEARTLSGAYLAATQAELRSDHVESALYYTRALAYDPENSVLLQRAMQAHVAKGDVAVAATIAERLLNLNGENQFATLVAMTQDIKENNPAQALARLDQGEQGMTPLLADLLRGWVLLTMGDSEEALAVFEAISGNDTYAMFGAYHVGLALGAQGRLEEASARMEETGAGPVRLNRRSTLARIQLLAATGEREAASSLVDEVLATGFGDAEFEALGARLAAGEEITFDVVRTAEQGVSEVFFDLASVLGNEGQDVALIYGRLATHLEPQFVEALLTVAGILRNQGQHELATEAYDAVPATAPQFIEAELGRAEALEDAERIDEAIGVLTSLTRAYPDRLRPHYLLGEALRQAERPNEAVRVLDRAVTLVGEPEEQHWLVFYQRAIAHHQADNWPAAEADFRQALELEPENPLVLNYLGYSLVEERRNLEEALDMIERAVAQRPYDGYITDSLGWVYYRLGRFEEAVEPMERAVELAPVDPIINDHLGDVYWMVDRKREAEFQWKRALSFDPEPEDRARILRKLDVGLDVVLQEEEANGVGDAPLEVAE